MTKRQAAHDNPAPTSFAVREALRRARIARSKGIPPLPIEGVHAKLAVVPPRRETSE